MSAQDFFQNSPTDSLSVISACNALTAKYRSILRELGRTNQLSENEMMVLVHLASYPEACTQKKLQGTNLDLSLSSICRMVESLRQKEYLSTTLDMNDRRSWILHLEEREKPFPTSFSSFSVSGWTRSSRISPGSIPSPSCICSPASAWPPVCGIKHKSVIRIIFCSRSGDPRTSSAFLHIFLPAARDLSSFCVRSFAASFYSSSLCSRRRANVTWPSGRK